MGISKMNDQERLIDFYNKKALCNEDITQCDYDSRSAKTKWAAPDVVFEMLGHLVSDHELLLDIGVGSGFSSEQFLSSRPHIVGIDIAENMLKMCAQKHPEYGLIYSNANNGFPLKDGTFDYVIASGILDMFYYLDNYFREVSRVLKRGAYFCFDIQDTENYDEIEFDYQDETPSFVIPTVDIRVYCHPKEILARLIEENGFVLLKRKKYLAYHRPYDDRDIIYQAYLVRKLAK